ncbi:glucosamine--fructose-6-phosphate aminotransferase [Stylonychia lemnae]|uniref:glutamine--fructose-6-phosphate transaminase (isomerizing) n=1 Tax=Stylonychia lemnae TaxID=5949 RepID=A0A077ZWR6_STYLE|nr:glucosamine--fructose-6-phosphate aminotransferase [Stylonychia lemnae]|eukprot:CDW73732.1 glucosamine--fructose-6-phosphate aminotransferase [Stylonychia lemnae]
MLISKLAQRHVKSNPSSLSQSLAFIATCGFYNYMRKNIENKNECGGILAYVNKDEDNAQDFMMQNAHFLQKYPYHQCGIALRDQVSNKVEVRKFTSLGEEQWADQLEHVDHDQFMNKSRISVPQEEDCFFKMSESFTNQDEKIKSRLGVLHSRYASTKGAIKENMAHPHSDEKSRVIVFHNGFIANYEDLAKQLYKNQGIKSETDSQLIAKLIGVEMDQGLSVKDAVKSVIEKKLMGTWKLAVMSVEQPDHIYFVKNSGNFIIGQSPNSVVVSTQDVVFNEGTVKCETHKIPNNHLVDLKDDCTFTMEKLEKKISVERQPKSGFDHIFEEEIYESADAVNAAIDFGKKFISNHQVYLGGFEDQKEELKLIQNLIIAANGSSKLAADYGAHIMKTLQIFNTVRVFDGHDIKKGDLAKVQQGGYLTLSQSGESMHLISALQAARNQDLTCINVVNVEDSPITKVGENLSAQGFDNSQNKNIGLYMKAGYCYCDVKSFIPEIVCMALVALWFSDAKTKKQNKEQKKLRQHIIEDLEMLNLRLKHALTDPYKNQYKEVGAFLRDHENLFILAKGTGFMIATYIAEKFTQVTTMHAEAYPSGEFRHGPLSMIDEAERTPVIFIVLNDEHLTQVISNIGQVRERGATIVVISLLKDITKIMDVSRIQFLIQLQPTESMFSALQACTALQMICYYASRAKGLNPDQQVFDAIDFNHEFQ